MITQPIAFFKWRTTRSTPFRDGPLQCVRCCSNCITKDNGAEDGESELMLGMKTYDNLLLRQPMWLSPYQTIQYHIGQLEILKKNLGTATLKPSIYVVSMLDSGDLKYLNMVLGLINRSISKQALIEPSTPKCDIMEKLKVEKNIALHIQINELEVFQLSNFLKPAVDQVFSSSEFDFNIIPVVISKDHDKPIVFGIGSLCVQILEPFSMREYKRGVYSADLSEHLARHVQYDLSRNSAILATHLVAFLILYLEREEGVTYDDLVIHMDWLRKGSIDRNLHIGFTGETSHAISIALLILRDYIDERQGVYVARNFDVLKDYADLVTPTIIIQGIISRAVLIEHNKSSPTGIRNSLGPGIVVFRNEVIETSCELIKLAEKRLPCVRPCSTMDFYIEGVLNDMVKFGRFFKIEEAKIPPRRAHHWTGECDSEDEEYYQANRDNPAFKSKILVTTRENRLDRLNLFLNAVEYYLY